MWLFFQSLISSAAAAALLNGHAKAIVKEMVLSVLPDSRRFSD
jgi:hypothetical protein